MRIAVFFLFILSDQARANCNAIVNGDYRFGSYTVVTPGLEVHSRKPEPGSLEARQPGIAKAVASVMIENLPYFEWSFVRPMHETEAREIFQRFQNIENELDRVARELSPSDRARFVEIAGILRELLQTQMKRFTPFTLTSQLIGEFNGLCRQTQATLFELLVSTLLDGEKFYFHRNVFEFYRGPYAAKDKHKAGDTEVDIIIKRHDGRDRWIEVKNNTMEWTVKDYAAWAGISEAEIPESIRQIREDSARSRLYGMDDSLVSQMRYQESRRRLLADLAPVELLLVSKYPIPEARLRELTESGIRAWPLYNSTRTFLPLYFEVISDGF